MKRLFDTGVMLSLAIIAAAGVAGIGCSRGDAAVPAPSNRSAEAQQSSSPATPSGRHETYPIPPEAVTGPKVLSASLAVGGRGSSGSQSRGNSGNGVRLGQDRVLARKTPAAARSNSSFASPVARGRVLGAASPRTTFVMAPPSGVAGAQETQSSVAAGAPGSAPGPEAKKHIPLVDDQPHVRILE